MGGYIPPADAGQAHELFDRGMVDVQEAWRIAFGDRFMAISPSKRWRIEAERSDFASILGASGTRGLALGARLVARDLAAHGHKPVIPVVAVLTPLDYFSDLKDR